MIENMVRVLNELLEADPKAANEFFNLRVAINKQVCDHPTIQVLADRTEPDSAQTGDTGVLRPLGLLNGLLQGDRVIVMMMNASETEITGFTTGTLTDGMVAPDAPPNGAAQ